MNLERFKQLIDIYGGSPYRWPSNERLTAETLLQTSAVARQWQQEALQLDRLIDNVVEITPPIGLKTRILAEVQILSREIDIWQWLVQWLWGRTLMQHLWRPVLVLGLPILLGIALGLSFSDQQAQLAESTVITQTELAIILSPDQEHLTEWEKWL